MLDMVVKLSLKTMCSFLHEWLAENFHDYIMSDVFLGSLNSLNYYIWGDVERETNQPVVPEYQRFTEDYQHEQESPDPTCSFF